jgi:hypothetical protein
VAFDVYEQRAKQVANLDFDDELNEEFERQVARLNAMQSLPLPEPSRPVAVVYGKEDRRWFQTFSEAATFAREAFHPGAYAIRNLAEPAPYVPMVTIKN